MNMKMPAVLPIDALPDVAKLMARFNVSLDEEISSFQKTNNKRQFEATLNDIVQDVHQFNLNFQHWLMEATCREDIQCLNSLSLSLSHANALISKAVHLVCH